MSPDSVPDDRRYTKTHEWARPEAGVLTMGITDHAQSELTDIVYVDLPAVDRAVEAGASVVVLESVKTVADVFSPVRGRVAEVNGELKAHPELINQDPYGRGWIVRIRFEGELPAAGLLSAEEYRAFVAREGAPS